MKAAFLSSSLISAKGTAGPASPSQPPKELLEKSKRAEDIYNGSPVSKEHSQSVPVVVPASSAIAASATPSISEPEQPSGPATERAHTLLRQQETDMLLQQKETDRLRKDNLGRVRMSIRMSPEQHLHLKLMSAHSRKSAQTIMEEALSEYVDTHGADLIPSSCACVRDKLYR
ncbi:MAG: hypothetical protein ABJN40_14130 [Sneathiella sp.]